MLAVLISGLLRSFHRSPRFWSLLGDVVDEEFAAAFVDGYLQGGEHVDAFVDHTNHPGMDLLSFKSCYAD
ncbi:hypothetical protein [Pedobacter deserti]|uniref:hypothetical protein n=1 Tax=Pedobacter deserti TaxID=2817382 RepID=UPI00210B9638|nr:hypothetical protein [Pedobacter sp. SYSU D00382]